MARIEYNDRAKASDRTREILDKNRNANIFRMMAHSPSYFEQYCRLGGAIRHKGELDPVVRELAITRTGTCARRPTRSSRTGGSARMSASPTSRTKRWRTGSRLPASTNCSGRRSRRDRQAQEADRRHLQGSRLEIDAGRAGRTAALGRLLHHDVEISRDLRDRHAAGDGSGELSAHSPSTDGDPQIISFLRRVDKSSCHGP
jgi:hypothetical protein